MLGDFAKFDKETMKRQCKALLIPTLFFGLLLTGCGSAQLFDSTMTQNSPNVPTSTPTLTPSPTATLTLPPVSVCHPNETIQGTINSSLPGYIDILSVSTLLKGTNLTVIFTLREIPDEITINRSFIVANFTELQWAVAIDTDNDYNTGSLGGYDFTLAATSFKRATEIMTNQEQKGTIENLFRNKIYIYTEHGAYSSPDETGILKVDQRAKTITLIGNIKGITPESRLTFFTSLQDNKPDNNPLKPDGFSDSICR